MADRRRWRKDWAPPTDHARTAGSAPPRRLAGWLVLGSRLFSTAAVCLAFAGCSVMGGSLRSPIDGLKPLPSGLWPKSKERSFAEAVENDPFPRADQANVRVSVSR